MASPAKKYTTRNKKRSVVSKSASRATVTLKHFVANLSEAHELSKKQTEAVLGDLIGLVTEHLKKGDRIRIGGLGILQIRNRAARTGRGRSTNELIRGDVSAALRPSVVRPAESAYEPSARARALLRGKEISERDLKESGGSFELRDVETLLGISRQAIDKKVRDDALVAVPGPHGRRRYPIVQFTNEGTLPGLQSVLQSLPSASGWFRLNFLITPDAHLGGRRPVDLLKEGKIDSVVMAAQAVGVQGA
jgi:nucleoid DNA-binding protein